MNADRELPALRHSRLKPTQHPWEQLVVACGTPAASSTASLAMLIFAYALVAWLWIFSDLAWFHVELFTVSEYVWSGPRAASLAAQFRTLFDWHVFDVSPYRLRTASDFVEIIDAVTRPAMRSVFGLHPSATLVDVALAAAIPAVFYKTMRRLGLSKLQAALLVVLLVSTTGYLSCFIPYIRPAKKLALLCCCLVLYLCLRIQDRPNGTLYAALFSVLLLGFLSDETGYALLPVSLVLLARPMVRRKGWAELAGFVLLLFAFLVVARAILPYLYSHVGESGPRDQALAGSVVLRLLGYLAVPRFYSFAFDDLGWSVLSSFGLIELSRTAMVGLLVLLLGVASISASLYFFSDRKQPDTYWNAAVSSIALMVFSFALTMFDWFDNPFASNYFATLTFYYHSAIAVMAVYWLANVCRALFASLPAPHGPLIANGVLTAAVIVIVTANVANFRVLDRLFEIVHTYPLEARSLDGTPFVSLKNLTLDDVGRTGQIAVSARRAALDAEYADLVRRHIGPHTADFEKALSIYRSAPIGGPQYVQRYVRLFYPNYDIRVTVLDATK